ncbi:hypothetical protein ABR737_22420 [Streptomyces sp. Edi2]|uniref:hypothetical protein n=1 Tax=Streptomyces sp. Edi2 TaxID=3162528 RepID=UPI00330683DA
MQKTTPDNDDRAGNAPKPEQGLGLGQGLRLRQPQGQQHGLPRGTAQAAATCSFSELPLA